MRILTLVAAFGAIVAWGSWAALSLAHLQREFAQSELATAKSAASRWGMRAGAGLAVVALTARLLSLLSGPTPITRPEAVVASLLFYGAFWLAIGVAFGWVAGRLIPATWRREG